MNRSGVLNRIFFVAWSAGALACAHSEPTRRPQCRAPAPEALTQNQSPARLWAELLVPEPQNQHKTDRPADSRANLRDCRGRPVRRARPIECARPFETASGLTPLKRKIVHISPVDTTAQLATDPTSAEETRVERALIWVMTHRSSQGERFGPLAMVQRNGQSVRVLAMGRLRAFPKGLELALWQAGGRAVVVAESTECARSRDGSRTCTRGAQLFSRRGSHLVAMTNEQNVCAPPARIALKREWKQVSRTDLPVSYSFQAELMPTPFGVLAKEHLTVVEGERGRANGSKKKSPDEQVEEAIERHIVRDVNARRELTFHGRVLRASARSLADQR